MTLIHFHCVHVMAKRGWGTTLRGMEMGMTLVHFIGSISTGRYLMG